METDLSYSINALRVKALFYGKKAMVYVEGPEDIVFWDPYFDRTVFELESVGGCKSLKPYIAKLEQGERSFIVACDSDYNSFTGVTYSSPLVVTTYGHSIENMMFCPYNLNETVRKLSKMPVDSSNEINNWYSTFVNSAKPLLVREIINVTYKPKENKIQVFGDNCAPYCKSKPCYELDDKKIKKFCDDNKNFFPQEEIARVENEIINDGRETRQLIKGHFYTHAVARLLPSLASLATGGLKVNGFSHDWLYSITVHCDKCCKEKCIDKEYIKGKVSNAILNLRTA